MEALLGLAKAIPPDTWLVGSLLLSAIVIGLDSVVTDLVGRGASWDDVDAGAHTDRELLSSDRGPTR
ncbi:hypothetical protein [Mycobacterium sp. EPa45]|uniref:hypothetical protein n=1 Tax=Mycobacterium sp. EPa45 TaxID=1545728 RepID=UPI000641A77B|nr:hypothetical protein [Mycobacterium sp. EPa45]AKK28901.1 hypothetical protein AB431_21995 [Mycobacterium sp. EPa45]